MSWINDRLKEPTTYIGLSLLVQSVGLLGKINEAPVIADSIAQAAEPLSQGDYVAAATTFLGGILAVLLREQGGNGKR